MNRPQLTAILLLLCCIPAALCEAGEKSRLIRNLEAGLSQEPVGWEVRTGEWAIRPEGLGHELSSCKALCTLNGGFAVYMAQQYDNLAWGVKIKNAPVFHEWNTRIMFRVQAENPDQYYFINRNRAGKIILGVSRARRDEEIIGESVRSIPVSSWLWLRIEATNNQFRVYTSTSGLEYEKVLDVMDEDDTFQQGFFGVSSQVHSHFQFNLQPWGENLTRKANGVWIESIVPSGSWYADYDRPVIMSVQAALFSMDAVESGTFSLKVGDETFPVGALRRGANSLTMEIPMPYGSASRELSAVLLDDQGREMEKASCKLDNPFSFDSASDFVSVQNVPSKISSVDRSEYLDYLNQIYLGSPASVRRGTRVSWPQALPALYVELYEATHDVQYLDELKYFLRNWLLAYREKGTIQGADFTARGPYCKTVLLLLEHGELTPEDRADLLALTSDMLVKGTYEAGGCMNRPLGYLIGMRQMVDLLPRHPMRGELNRYIENSEKSILHHLEELENSSNYQGLTLCFLIQWIELNNRQDLYQNPRLKNSFERALLTQTPYGGIAPFGDYGNADNADMHLLAVFEKAATVYRDGRFKTAARKMFDRIRREPPEKINALQLSGLSSAFLWADDSVAPELIPAESTFSHRNNGDADKVVLQNDNAYVLFDMINGREHGDNNTLGLMAFVSGNQYRLFDQGGRIPDAHSLPMVADKKEDFPFKQRRKDAANPAEPGRWALAELYLPNHWSWMNFSGGTGGPTQYSGVFTSSRHAWFPYEYTYFPKTEFSFILNFIGSGKNSVQIDDVKLIHADGSEKVLADFEDNVWGWRGHVESCDDGFESAASARFDLDLDAGFNTIGRVFQMPLDVDNGEWKKISFRYKLGVPASRDVAIRFATVGDVRGYPRNYLFHHNPMFVGEVDQFDAERNYVKMRLNEKDLYGRPQRKTREAALNDDGSLVIRDHIEVLDEFEYVCGPLFHVEKLFSRGENWFEAAADGRVLIWFEPRADAICGVGAVARSPQTKFRYNPVAVYQKAVGSAPANETFTAVLYPLDEGDDPKEIAGTLQAKFEKIGINL